MQQPQWKQFLQSHGAQLSNLRIVHDNAANRATLTASSTAGALVAANLLTELKGQVHRSVGTSVTYTLVWAVAETVAGVAIPACNLTADSTIRVRGYSAGAGGTLLVDTGIQYACPGRNLQYWDWTQPLNSNAFAYGGYSKALCWLNDHYAVKRIEIDIADPTNAAGYIDAARLVVGAYWSPEHNASYGATNDVIDSSKNTRNDAGDLLSDRLTLNESMELDLEYMQPSDRARMNQIMRSSGIHKPMLVSLVPDGEDPLLQQDTLIYGKRENAPIVFSVYNSYNATIKIEGW